MSQMHCSKPPPTTFMTLMLSILASLGAQCERQRRFQPRVSRNLRVRYICAMLLHPPFPARTIENLELLL